MNLPHQDIHNQLLKVIISIRIQNQQIYEQWNKNKKITTNQINPARKGGKRSYTTQLLPEISHVQSNYRGKNLGKGSCKINNLRTKKTRWYRKQRKSVGEEESYKTKDAKEVAEWTVWVANQKSKNKRGEVDLNQNPTAKT